MSIVVWFITIGHVYCRVPHYRPCLLVSRHCNRHFTSQVQMEEGWLHVQRCHYIRHVCRSSASHRYACLYSATLPDRHAVFINSDSRVCKVLLYQARYLVCYKVIRLQRSGIDTIKYHT